MSSAANTNSLNTNFNVSPYYDDFDESKNFHRILFRPGLAVQARELTQMQSIQQNQIDRFAEHIFKEGSSVRGMEVAPLDNQYDYVKLRDLASDGSTSVNVYSLLTKTMKGATSGVLGKIVNVNDGSQANTPNFKTLFVDYVSGNTSTGYRTFANNEILTEVVNGVLTANTITGLQGGACGYGSAITINSGIVFGKDHFIRVDAQTIVLDKYSSTPSYRVGYNILETIVSSADDSSLLDPASGAFNFAAPGANRLKLTAVIAKNTLANTSANNFIEYLTLKDGVIQTKSDAPQYSMVRDELAKRTNEESGNYIVRGLTPRAREHLLSGNNNGVFTSALGGLATQLSIDIEPGKAYVQGYDNELLVTQHVAVDKGIDYVDVTETSTYTDYGNYIVVDNFVGSWDVEGQNLISLRGRGSGASGQANSISTRKYSNLGTQGAEIGKARVRAVELYSGYPGMPNALYKMYLSDIRITTVGKSFANVEALHYTANTGFANGAADIWRSNNKSANTNDSALDTAVFRLPANAIRRLRDSANTVDTSFEFWKTMHGSFSSSGVLTLTLTGDEQFATGNPLSSDSARSNFYVTVRASTANTTAFTGTITTSAGSNTVTGVGGTTFLSDINIGDLIRISNTGSVDHIVTSITSDTSMTLLNTVANARTGMPYWKQFKRGQQLDLGGVGRDGARSIVTTTSTATIDINETSSSGFTASVICKVKKTAIQEAGKTINRDRYIRIKIGGQPATGYFANTSGPWSLGLSDVHRIVSVRRHTGAFASITDGTDVSSHFYLDNGQRDSYYSHAQLVKKPTSNLSITGGDFLLVKLDYYSHTNRDRGYFSVDSYPVNDTTAGSDTNKIYTYEIPVFVSPRTGIAFDLRNCVDFRPRLTDSANDVTTLTNISTNPLGIQTSNNKLSAPDFDEPNGGLRFPHQEGLFTTDLSYYLPRKDLITMDKFGTCEVLRGVSSNRPTTPRADADKMTLAVIEIAPYPSLSDSVAKSAGRYDLANNLHAIKNERFTMRDIGVIRDRVERLEYYTTLSLLERDAKEAVIRTSTGTDRFKNGFLVDGFNGHSVGNVYDPDYKCAIDPAKGELRPSTKIDNIELFLNAANSSNIVRTNVTINGVARDHWFTVSNTQVTFSNNSTITWAAGVQSATVRYKVANRLYVENATATITPGALVSNGLTSTTVLAVTAAAPGKLITLPYRHDKVISQPFASTTRNASGLFYSWVGTLSLDPNSDYWVDTVRLPDVQINIDNSADNWEAVDNSFGTVWGAWETVATGTTVTFTPDPPRVRPTLVEPEDNWLTFIDGVNGGFGVTGVAGRGGGRRAINRDAPNVEADIAGVQTFTSTIDQVRVGTQTGINLSTQTQTIGDIIRDVNIQPFMRSRIVRLTARGMKPSSKLYAFFDGTDINDYITQTNSAFEATGDEGDQIVSSSAGNVYALLRIPNDESLAFRTGEKIIRLTDSITNSSVVGSVTTSAQATYASQGLTTSVAGQTISTTVREIVTNSVSETRTIQEISQVETQTIGHLDGLGFIDPIAQSFTVDTKATGRVDSSGAYITKVDLFFASKDAVQPVIVELREVDSLSGYITPKLLGYGRAVIEPSAINVSDNASAATPVYFPSPVYVENEKQYAIVILPGGGNPNCSVWISRLGENDIVTGTRITTQPAAGMMFASSNDRTYTALQEEDMKFAVYFANFTVASSGTIVFKNEDKDFLVLSNTSSGFTTTGEVVRGETYMRGTFVPGNLLTGNIAPGKAFVQGMVSGATGRVTYLSVANSEMRVANVSPTATFRGGEAIRFRVGAVGGTITGNSTGGIRYAIYPHGKVSFYDATTSSNTYLHLANVSYTNSGSATGIVTGNNNAFMTNRWIKSKSGSSAKIAAFYQLNADVINVKGDYILPSNTTITPGSRFAKSATTKDQVNQNLNLNRDTVQSTRRYVFSKSQESNTSLTFAAMKEKSAEVRFALTSTNRYGSPAFDTTRISVTLIENLLNNSTSGEANTVSGGYADARYITRKVVLAEGQDAEDLIVYLDAYKPPGAEVTVYYKVLNAEDSDIFSQARWVQMNQLTNLTSISGSENKNDFREYQYGVMDYPSGAGAGEYNSGLFGNSSPTRILSYRNSLNGFYEGYKYFAIKIVLTGTDTTNPPRVKNLRAIALQK